MKRTKHTRQILSPLAQRCAQIGARTKEIAIMPDERAPYRFAVLHHAATGKHFLIPGPTDVAAAGPDVVEHLGKQWTDLSESEGNKVAREVGLLAHRILHADLTDTKKSLH